MSQVTPTPSWRERVIHPTTCDQCGAVVSRVRIELRRIDALIVCVDHPLPRDMRHPLERGVRP